ncbi:hypothetical protein E1262_03105 [Jiangella aurantiaca]|uniref:Uncharacterized protein n=2 Tax=Jiangella aurantiaca TaxID=2530373 RepID=A0A4R5AI29_9ACTN|nr:hypothetical protein E1262_03105 [Jiangella aurantiaca]
MRLYPRSGCIRTGTVLHRCPELGRDCGAEPPSQPAPGVAVPLYQSGRPSRQGIEAMDRLVLAHLNQLSSPRRVDGRVLTQMGQGQQSVLAAIENADDGVTDHEDLAGTGAVG